MRFSRHVLFICTVLAPPAMAATTRGPMDMEIPAAVALSEDQPGHWAYKSFPNFLPLYVFDGDRPGKSTCDHVCAAVWPVLKAEDGDTPKGDWSIVARDGGDRQWAYRGRPVYTFYLDTPNNPHGVGRGADWYNEEYAPDGTARKVAAKAAPAKPAWRLLEP